MNARTPTKFVHGAATWSVHTHPGWFRVDLDDDFRIISRDGSGFIAWIGSQFKCWHFTKALDVCVEDMEHQAFLRTTALAEQAAAEAHNAAIPKPVRIAATEMEIALLDMSDDPNSCARQDRLRAQLEAENVHA